jgi:hypothetical protein
MRTGPSSAGLPRDPDKSHESNASRQDKTGIKKSNFFMVIPLPEICYAKHLTPEAVFCQEFV